MEVLRGTVALVAERSVSGPQEPVEAEALSLG